jgi:hypothetical protein
MMMMMMMMMMMVVVVVVVRINDSPSTHNHEDTEIYGRRNTTRPEKRHG